VSELSNREGDEEPRKSLWASLPRGTVTRTFVLLALLAGVVMLQRKAGAIAGCMNQTLMLPQPRAVGRASSGATERGPIRVQVQVPGAATR
jgi:alkylated DNA nucleotide flippase Atl1